VFLFAIELTAFRKLSDTASASERCREDDEAREQRGRLDGARRFMRLHHIAATIGRERILGDARLARERERSDDLLHEERALADDRILDERWDRQQAEAALAVEWQRAARKMSVVRDAQLALAEIAEHLQGLVEEMVEGDLGRRLRHHAEATRRCAETARRLVAQLVQVEVDGGVHELESVEAMPEPAGT